MAAPAYRFQILDISEGAGVGSQSVFHVFGRDAQGNAHHVRVVDVPSFIVVGVSRRHHPAPLDEAELNEWASQLNSQLLRRVNAQRQCRRSKCRCQYAQKDPDPTAAWVSINTAPCLLLQKTDSVACVGARAVWGRPVLGYYPEQAQFIEFELARTYYVQPAQGLLYAMLRERGWHNEDECEVYNVQTDATLQFMSNSVRLNPAVTVGGGRWMEYSNTTVPFSEVRMVDAPGNAPLCRLAFDLETDFVDGESKAHKNPILCVSLSFVHTDGREEDLCLTWVQGEVAPPKRNYTPVFYADEKAMLRGFEEYVQAKNPDIICGYNSDSFDWPYLLDRAAAIGVELRLGRIRNDAVPTFMFLKQSFTNQSGTKKKGVFYLPGRVPVDYIPVVEDRCKDFAEFNLDYVMKHLFSPPPPDYDPLEDADPLKFFQGLGRAAAKEEESEKGKLKMSYADISPWFFGGTPEQKQYLLEYCVVDAKSVHHIEGKLGALNTVTAECRVVGILMKHYLALGKQMRIMRLLSDFAHRDAFFMPKHEKVFYTREEMAAKREACAKADPTMSKEALDRKMAEEPTYHFRVPFYGADAVLATEYEGAMVLDPIRGFHRGKIACGDMESLYPNKMRSENLCLTTYVRSWEDAEAKGLAREDVFEGPPAWQERRLLFARKHKGQGLLPKLLETLLNERKRIRAEQKTVSAELYAVYEAWQVAVKVVANSVYGACGAPTGPIFCVQVASTVTASGRKTIMDIKRHVETSLPVRTWYSKDICRRVVYGDTDSVMFELLEEDGATPQEALQKAQEYIDHINGAGLFEAPMRMACECVYSPFLIQSPKIYSAFKYEAGKKPKLQQKGTVAVKRNNCLYVRETYRNLMHRLMIMNQEPDRVFAAMRGRFQALLLGDVPLGRLVMTAKLSKPAEQYEGNGNPHVQVARQWQAEQPFTAPRVGERVPHVIVRGDPRVSTVQARPPYCIRPGGDTINLAYYFERLKTPIEDVMSAVFIDRQTQLGVLFDINSYVRDVGFSAANPVTGHVHARVVRPRGAGAPVAAGQRQSSLGEFIEELAAVVPSAKRAKTTRKRAEQTSTLAAFLLRSGGGGGDDGGGQGAGGGAGGVLPHP